MYVISATPYTPQNQTACVSMCECVKLKEQLAADVVPLMCVIIIVCVCVIATFLYSSLQGGGEF